jgi:hypothetical protein
VAPLAADGYVAADGLGRSDHGLGVPAAATLPPDWSGAPPDQSPVVADGQFDIVLPAGVAVAAPPERCQPPVPACGSVAAGATNGSPTRVDSTPNGSLPWSPVPCGVADDASEAGAGGSDAVGCQVWAASSQT